MLEGGGFTSLTIMIFVSASAPTIAKCPACLNIWLSFLLCFPK